MLHVDIDRLVEVRVCKFAFGKAFGNHFAHLGDTDVFGCTLDGLCDLGGGRAGPGGFDVGFYDAPVGAGTADRGEVDAPLPGHTPRQRRGFDPRA